MRVARGDGVQRRDARRRRKRVGVVGAGVGDAAAELAAIAGAELDQRNDLALSDDRAAGQPAGEDLGQRR